MEGLNELLRAADQLKTFEIQGRSNCFGQLGPFTEFTFAQFCDLLENHPSLENVIFHPVVEEHHSYDMMGFDDDTPQHHFNLGNVASALSKMANLKSLDLHPKVLHPQMHYYFNVSSITAILGNSTIEELSISKSISQALSTSESLVELRLSRTFGKRERLQGQRNCQGSYCEQDAQDSRAISEQSS